METLTCLVTASRHNGGAIPVSLDDSLRDLTFNELRSRIARAHLFLVEIHFNAGSASPSADLRRERVEHFRDLEARSILYGYGPVTPADDAPPYEMAVVAVPSQPAAEQLAARDPANREGLMSFSVTGHTINEGVACYFARALAVNGDEDRCPAYAIKSGSLAEHTEVPLHLLRLESTSKPLSECDDRTKVDHFVWLRTNEMNAALMSCGPLGPRRYDVWGRGLAVVATSRREAERIATTEPSDEAGFRTVSVHDWTLTHGLSLPIAQALVTVNRINGI